MIPKNFIFELWREFIPSLEGKTHISKSEIKILFKEVYFKSLNLYESRYFQFLTKEEKEWIRNYSKNLENEAMDVIIKMGEEKGILISFENEWIIDQEKIKLEKNATKWEIIGHHWDKRTGFNFF